MSPLKWTLLQPGCVLRFHYRSIKTKAR